jgi:hypothetical protein
MHTFILIIIGLVMTSEFIVQKLDLPPFLHFLPEMLSAVLIVYVFIAGTRDRFRLVAPKYWIAFAALGVVMICGIINSGTGSGPMITGMRFYFRALPMFFVATLLPLTEGQFKVQLKWLLLLSLLQLPVAGYQRWVIYSLDRYSGDDVRGTVMDSGILSMYLISAVMIMLGILLKRRIGWKWFTVLFFLLLLPTTINETKATVIFLPMGLLVVLIIGSEPGKRLRYAGFAMLALFAFGAIFVPIYDMLEEHNHYKVGLIDFFTHEDQLDRYLVAQGRNRGTGIGGTKLSGRGDAIVVPVTYLARDPVNLAFGVGLGNASPSNVGRNKAFEGAYYLLFRSVLVTSFSYFVIELGMLGVLIICGIYWMMFADGVYVARRDPSLMGGVAAGWAGVVAIFWLGMIYTVFYQFPAVIYLYWYFAGLVSARRVELEQEARTQVRAAPARAALQT